jgi:hypothetical protein
MPSGWTGCSTSSAESRAAPDERGARGARLLPVRAWGVGVEELPDRVEVRERLARRPTRDAVRLIEGRVGLGRQGGLRCGDRANDGVAEWFPGVHRVDGRAPETVGAAEGAREGRDSWPGMGVNIPPARLREATRQALVQIGRRLLPDA